VKTQLNKLSYLYALIAFSTLVLCWKTNMYYVDGFYFKTFDYLKDLLVSNAAISTTIDIILVGLTMQIWMIVESKRLEIKKLHLLGYTLIFWFVAIGTGLPMFLIHREIILNKKKLH
jgi:hypothetical protein